MSRFSNFIKEIIILFVINMFLAGLPVPENNTQTVDAESAWKTASYDDFNGTGSQFGLCEMNGTGNESGIVIQKEGDWNIINMVNKPSARKFGAMTAIDNDYKLVLFGGYDGKRDLNDTWIYDFGNNIWQNCLTSDNPSARDQAQITSIYGEDKTILFGGQLYFCSTYISFNDTWIYDVSDNNWQNCSIPNSPSCRYRSAIGSISSTDKIILFGGSFNSNGTDALNDTWLYNFSAHSWSQVYPSDSPPARYGHLLASISGDDKLILYGGSNLGNIYNDTWIYDLSENKWSNAMTSDGPTSQDSNYGSMTSFPQNSGTLLFASNGATWSYNMTSNHWRRRHTDHVVPNQYGVSLSTILNINKMVLFGGGKSNPLNTTWIYDPNAYGDSATYISPYYDIGDSARFLKISWLAALPDNTSVLFQGRTAKTLIVLQSKEFLGPDGTSFSYYNISGTNLLNLQSGDRWVQFLVRLYTTNVYLTPKIQMVTITYTRYPGPPELITPGNISWLNTTHPIFNWRFNDSDSSSQAAYEWQLDSSQGFQSVLYESDNISSNQTSYTPIEEIREGVWYWRVRSSDGDDWGPFSNPSQFGVDITPPQPFVPSATPDSWTNDSCVISFATKDNVSGIDNYNVLIDEILYSNQTSPYIIPILPDGIHEVVVRASDKAGNSIEGTVQIYIDRTPPESFTPVAELSSWSNAVPQISFRTTDALSGIDHYEIQVDEGKFKGCKSPYNLTQIGNGGHHIVVRAFDTAGNHRDGQVTVFFDKTPPSWQVLSTDSIGWTNKDPILSFQAADNISGIDRYELKLDNGDFAPESSPYILANLKDGEHNITVRAIDMAGNYAEGSIDVYSDKTPPLPFTPFLFPDNWTMISPTISFNTSDASSGVERYELRIDDGPFVIVNSPHIADRVSDGWHSITIRAYDRAGNYADSSTWISIDKNPPTGISFTIIGGASFTVGKTVMLVISANDNASGLDAISFSNDGINYTPWEQYVSVKNWTLTEDVGQKIVYMKVKDKVGNAAEPVSATIIYKPNKPVSKSEMQISTFLFPIVIVILLVSAISYYIYRRWTRRI